MDTSEGKDNEEIGLGQRLLETPEKEPFSGDRKEEEEAFGCLMETPASVQLPEDNNILTNLPNVGEIPSLVEPPPEPNHVMETENDDANNGTSADQVENAGSRDEVLDVKIEKESARGSSDMKEEANGFSETAVPIPPLKQEMPVSKQETTGGEYLVNNEGLNHCFLPDPDLGEGYDSGTEEEQAAFMNELANFFKEKGLEFKPPKFYGLGLNCLKLWRAVIRLGGYDTVTSCKLWRQVGESFKPPKTCTTVSWSFRCFYEKALLDYERHKVHGGELNVPVTPQGGPMTTENQVGSNQASGSGRARRDAAARAMQGWHSQRLLSNGEVGDAVIKDNRNSAPFQKREKQLKSLGVLKRKKSSSLDRAVKVAHPKVDNPQLRLDTMVDDVGPRADWVKINVQRTNECFEVYALVPGLLREEIHVQTDPAGRLVIAGKPEQPDNPWGVTPFKKIITLPSRIDPHQTSAVFTLHGQLFVRLPFEQ